MHDRKCYELDCSISGIVGGPTDLSHQVFIVRLLDAQEIRIQLCSIRLMEVCQYAQKQNRFKCETLGVRGLYKLSRIALSQIDADMKC
jgi:hypothetical protein